MVIPYLSYLVYECGNQEAHIHNQLALLYLETILYHQQQQQQQCHLSGETSTINSAYTTSKDEGEGDEEILVNTLRTELLHFIHFSAFSSADELCVHFAPTTLCEEYAALLHKCERYEEAIQVYVLKIRSIEVCAISST